MSPPQAALVRLIALLKDRSLKLGDFTLASGRRSSCYIDARKSTMSAVGLELIGELGLAEIARAGWRPRAVGGLTMGADPVAYAIARASAGSSTPIDAFSVRKQPKAHGTKQQIEGCFDPGIPVVVVEDVITSGGSALDAVHAVEAAGGSVHGVLTVVDRQEGGRETLEATGHPVRSLVTLTDLGIECA